MKATLDNFFKELDIYKKLGLTGKPEGYEGNPSIKELAQRAVSCTTTEPFGQRAIRVTWRLRNITGHQLETQEITSEEYAFLFQQVLGANLRIIECLY